MNTRDFEQEVNQVLSRLMAAWAAGDGTTFASAFTEEADFVPYFGIHVQGRAGIVNAHQTAFDSFLKGSKLRYQLKSIRPIEENIFIVHTLGAVIGAGEDEFDITPTAIQSFVMVKKNGELVIESFQNTVIQDSP